MRTALTVISVDQIKIFIVKHFQWTYEGHKTSGNIWLVFASGVFSYNKIILIFYHLGILWYVLDLMSCVSYFTDAHSTCTYTHIQTLTHEHQYPFKSLADTQVENIFQNS